MIPKIKNLIIRFANVDIVKVFSLTAISTIVKMLTGFIAIKIISVILGPEGLAIVGQLNNFATIIMAVASVGINNGVTKYIAEYKNEYHIFKNLLSAAYRITLIGSLLCGIFMIVTHSFLGNILFHTHQYNYVFVIFGATITLYALNNLLISIVNGLKLFKLFVIINIVNSIVGMGYTIALVVAMGLKGALISFVTYQSISLIVTFFILHKCEWFTWDNFKVKISIPIVKKYLHYTLMTLVSVSVVPVSQLFLRSYVITHISGIEAGWWEGMNRLSNMYLLVITSSFGIYYLPRLSELQLHSEIKREIFKAYKVILPILIVGFAFIYLLKFVIIKILFTPEFYPMSNLFGWQLLGDFFKIASWLLAFLMIAKSRTIAFISTEIISSAIYLLLGLFLVQHVGIMGLVQAYCVNYVLYLLVMIILFHKILFAK